MSTYPGPLAQHRQWLAAGLITVVALARMALGVDAPTDVLVGVGIGVTIPLLLFRRFTPNEVFPVSYRRGRAAHLDVGGTRVRPSGGPWPTSWASPAVRPPSPI